MNHYDKLCGKFSHERVGRIELPSVAWEATVLPLYDTRSFILKTDY